MNLTCILCFVRPFGKHIPFILVSPCQVLYIGRGFLHYTSKHSILAKNVHEVYYMGYSPPVLLPCLTCHTLWNPSDTLSNKERKILPNLRGQGKATPSLKGEIFLTQNLTDYQIFNYFILLGKLDELAKL